jgi:hypothetical protein
MKYDEGEITMAMRCPVCNKQYESSLKVARHVFGTGDKVHKAWVNSRGVSFTDLLIRQATASGNQSFLILAGIIEKAQGQLDPLPNEVDALKKPYQQMR